MSGQVEVFARIRGAFRKPGRLALVRAAVWAALRQVPARAAAARQITIVLGDDAQLHELNRAFRGYDKPTDVLSFEGEGGGPGYLGDVIISMERCAAQAARAGHTESDELALLIVHGTLHLLGFDHMTPADKRAMWEPQRAALRDLRQSGKLPGPVARAKRMR